jgi:hypothetical protein
VSRGWSRRRFGSPKWCAPAAVAEAGDVTDQDLVRAESKAVGHDLAAWLSRLPLVALDDSLHIRPVEVAITVRHQPSGPRVDLPRRRRPHGLGRRLNGP